jgi:hypothetical protein
MLSGTGEAVREEGSGVGVESSVGRMGFEQTRVLAVMVSVCRPMIGRLFRELIILLFSRPYIQCNMPHS